MTKLHQISLVELNQFTQDKSDKRAGVFRFELHYQTQTPDIVLQVIKTEYPGGKQLIKQQII